THKEKDFLEFVNPESLKVVTGYVEPSLKLATNEDKFQFQRLGYFCVDKNSTPDKPVFNKTVGLRDAWEERGKKEENAINNGLKEINKYFKVDSQDERRAIEKSVAENIASVSNFSLLQNTVRKNVNNNKSSLLFVNWILKYSKNIHSRQIDAELMQKLYDMSLRSESWFVRFESAQNVLNDEFYLPSYLTRLRELQSSEKNEAIAKLIADGLDKPFDK